MVMPADFIISILSSAPPFPPEIIAPACPILLPGGAVRPAINPTIGFFIFDGDLNCHIEALHTYNSPTYFNIYQQVTYTLHSIYIHVKYKLCIRLHSSTFASHVKI